MVEKVRNTFSDKVWEIIISSLLTILIAVIGFSAKMILTSQNEIKILQKEMGVRVETTYYRQIQIGRVLVADPDTSPDAKDELRQWVNNTRGGNTTPTNKNLNQ